MVFTDIDYLTTEVYIVTMSIGVKYIKTPKDAIAWVKPGPLNTDSVNKHICGCSSVGRAVPCQGTGQGFESPYPLK